MQDETTMKYFQIVIIVYEYLPPFSLYWGVVLVVIIAWFPKSINVYSFHLRFRIVAIIFRWTFERRRWQRGCRSLGCGDGTTMIFFIPFTWQQLMLRSFTAISFYDTHALPSISSSTIVVPTTLSN